jgi:hypothetical protein
VIALISINSTALGAKTLGAGKKEIRIRVRKNKMAAGFPACGAWRRSVIDSTSSFGTGENQPCQ